MHDHQGARLLRRTESAFQYTSALDLARSRPELDSVVSIARRPLPGSGKQSLLDQLQTVGSDCICSHYHQEISTLGRGHVTPRLCQRLDALYITLEACNM